MIRFLPLSVNNIKLNIDQYTDFADYNTVSEISNFGIGLNGFEFGCTTFDK